MIAMTTKEKGVMHLAYCLKIGFGLNALLLQVLGFNIQIFGVSYFAGIQKVHLNLGWALATQANKPSIETKYEQSIHVYK